MGGGWEGGGGVVGGWWGGGGREYVEQPQNIGYFRDYIPEPIKHYLSSFLTLDAAGKGSGKTTGISSTTQPSLKSSL